MDRISVIVPAKNAARTIEAALRSCLESDNVGEVILVDDISSDDTVARALALGDERVRVVPGPGQGIAAAFNAGLAAVRFPLVARCDADDGILPGRLGAQARILADRPEAVAVSSGYLAYDPKGRLVAELATDGELRDVTGRLLSGQPVTSFCTWLTRTSGLRGVGGANPWFEIAEDVDLAARLAARGQVWHLPVAGYRCELHAGSVTHRATSLRRGFFDACARQLARQRLLSGAEARMPGGRDALFLDDRGGRAEIRGAPDHIADLAIGQAWRHLRAGRRTRALASACLALTWRMGRLSGWRTLALVALRVAMPRRMAPQAARAVTCTR